MSAFFWIIWLAHLLGDYPLQTDRLAAAKKTWGGLTVHVAIHLALLFLLVNEGVSVLWPYLLVLGAVHFTVDALKNWFNRVRPESLVSFYVLDQLLHLLSLIGVVVWAGQSGALVGLENAYLLSKWWAILGCGLVFVTFMWGISERIFFHKRVDFVAEAIAQKWPRLATRGLLYAALVAMGVRALSPTLSLTVAVALPYLSGVYRRQALLSDGGIALLTAIVVLALLE